MNLNDSKSNSKRNDECIFTSNIRTAYALICFDEQTVQSQSDVYNLTNTLHQSIRFGHVCINNKRNARKIEMPMGQKRDIWSTFIEVNFTKLKKREKNPCIYFWHNAHTFPLL